MSTTRLASDDEDAGDDDAGFDHVEVVTLAASVTSLPMPGQANVNSTRNTRPAPHPGVLPADHRDDDDADVAQDVLQTTARGAQALALGDGDVRFVSSSSVADRTSWNRRPPWWMPSVMPGRM